MSIDAASLRVVVSADTSKAEQGLKSFSGGMKNIAGGMAAVGGVLSATIAAPLIGIGVSAIKTAASFEKSMNVLEYVTGGTADTMQKMQDQALQLGADTVFSAGEAAEGMVELAKAGMKTEDVMDAIPGVMDLAAAGQMAVGEAAGLTAAALNTFGLEAEKATSVADVLAAAANASSADVSDLAFGVKNAGSVFAANGQSVESLATLMAILANNGIDASDAATSLKTMTMRLTAPTDKAAAVMRKMGIAVFDADGNMRDYRDIVEDMEDATRDMSDAQKSAAFNTVFGADAIRAALIVSREGAAGYDEMMTAVTEQGAAAEMASAQNKGLEGAINALAGSFETLQIKLALPFLEKISEWMGKIAELVNKMGEIPQPLIEATLIFLGIAGAAGVAMVAISGIATAIGALETLGIAGIVGTMGAAVLGLAAAAAAAYLIWSSNWGGIQQKTEEVLAAIQPLIDTLVTSLTTMGTSIGTMATDFGTKLTEAFTEADIPTFDELFADLLEGDFSGMFGKLQKGLDSLVLNLETELKVSMGMAEDEPWEIGKRITQMANDITAAVNSLDLTTIDWWDMLDRLILKPLSGAIAVISFSAETFGALVTAVTAAITAIPWGDLGGALSGLGTAIITQLGTVVNDIIADLTPLFFLMSLSIGEQVRLLQAQMLPKEPAATPADSGTMEADFAKVPATVASRLVTEIETYDWAGTGTTMGNVIGVAIGGAFKLQQWMDSIVFTVKPTGLLEAVDGMINTASDAMIAAMGTNEAWAKVGAAYAEGFESMINNLVNTTKSVLGIGGPEPKKWMTEAYGWGKIGPPEKPEEGLFDFSTMWDNMISSFQTGLDSTIAGIGAAITAWGARLAADIQLVIDTWSAGSPGVTDPSQGPFGDLGLPAAGLPSGFSQRSARTHRSDPNIESLFEGMDLAAEGTGFGSNFKTAVAPVGTEIGNDAATAIKTHAAMTKGPDPILSQQKNLLDGFKLPELDWASAVLPLLWSEFVTAINWSTYITNMVWGTFVSTLAWESHVPNISWSSYVSYLDWGNYISWLQAPVPAAGSNASGTPYWKGGMTWVGEEGPELINLPQGTRIHSNEESMGMGGTTINVFVDSINSALDIEALAAQLARRFQQKMRS